MQFSLAVFPEGTFFRPPGVLPFRLGAFRTAVDARRPIVPITLRGPKPLARRRLGVGRVFGHYDVELSRRCDNLTPEKATRAISDTEVGSLS